MNKYQPLDRTVSLIRAGIFWHFVLLPVDQGGHCLWADAYEATDADCWQFFVFDQPAHRAQAEVQYPGSLSGGKHLRRQAGGNLGSGHQCSSDERWCYFCEAQSRAAQRASNRANPVSVLRPLSSKRTSASRSPGPCPLRGIGRESAPSLFGFRSTTTGVHHLGRTLGGVRLSGAPNGILDARTTKIHRTIR